MNERIQELAGQAWNYALDHETVNGKAAFDSFINKNFSDLLLEKFAELIVQECAGVCAGIAAVRAGYNDVDGRDTAYSCGDTIKEYFGVE